RENTITPYEICQRQLCPALDRDYVVDLKGNPVVSLRQVAVLTPAVRPLPDCVFEGFLHGGSRLGHVALERSACLRLHDRQEITDAQIVLEFLIFIVRERTFPSHGSKFIHTVPVCLIEVECEDRTRRIG